MNGFFLSLFRLNFIWESKCGFKNLSEYFISFFFRKKKRTKSKENDQSSNFEWSRSVPHFEEHLYCVYHSRDELRMAWDAFCLILKYMKFQRATLYSIKFWCWRTNVWSMRIVECFVSSNISSSSWKAHSFDFIFKRFDKLWNYFHIVCQSIIFHRFKMLSRERERKEKKLP